MSDAFVVQPDSGRMLDLGTFQAEVLADGTATGQAFSLLHTRDEPPGFGPPLHRHRDAAEAFYVLEGTYLMFADDREVECPPGAFVYVPRGMPHTFKVISATPGRKLNVFAPSAMVGFFEALSSAAAVGEPTPEMLERIALDNDMEILGPIPDSYV